MTTLLEKYTESNEKILSKMQDNITDLKLQVADIKSSNEKFTSILSENMSEMKMQIDDIKSSATSIITEQCNLKEQITSLKSQVSINDGKIKMLEANGGGLNVHNSSNQNMGSISPPQLNEKLIREVQERNEREKNIIIVGLPESTFTTTPERISDDETNVINITRAICEDVSDPIKVIRIGKYDPSKNRRVKVIYQSKFVSKQILRNREKAPNHIKIYSDQTPAQQKYMQTLKDELNRRQNNGDINLAIKYVNGTPCIISTNPKN